APPTPPARPQTAPSSQSAPPAPPPPAKTAAPPREHDAGPATRVAQAPSAQPQPAAAPATATSGGDAAAGRQGFRKCQACHSMEAGKNMLGPSLAGIIGRKAGTEAGYSYSPAMKQADITWDAKTLDGYLDNPQKVVPGNKMPFPGLKTENDRI